MSNLSYRASLKNPEVEEPIDLLLHRPIGYAIARAALPLGISPDALTIASMLLGIASAGCFASVFFGAGSHPILGGALLIASAIFDCSDGQLARMGARSSRHGRMLDGAVDAVVQMSAVPAMVAHMFHRRAAAGADDALLWLILAAVAAVTGVRHTSLYDHVKNVYVRNTEAKPGDCDDRDEVEAEWVRLRASGSVGAFAWFRYTMYRMHLGLVEQTVRWIDPFVPPRFRDMPAFAPERAQRFRSMHRPLMRAWSFFGVGTHIFLMAACAMIDRLEWYIVLRAVGFNAALALLTPVQRRASRAFFQRELPDGTPATA